MSSLLKNPISVVIITIIAVFYYLSLNKSAQKASISSQTVAQIEEERTLVSNEVTQLEKQLEGINHPISQEKALRNELLLQKPGEYVLQLPSIEVSEAQHAVPKEPSAWDEWRKILFE